MSTSNQTDRPPSYERTQRLLARLSGGRQWDPVGAPGGKAAITWEDLTRALAKLKARDKEGRSRPDILSRSLLERDFSIQAHVAVVDELAVRVSRWAVEQGWRKRTYGAAGRIAWFRGMVAMALAELTHRRHCGECGTTGGRWISGLWVTQLARDEQGVERTRRHWMPGHWEFCRACGGLGSHPWSKRKRALRMGVNPSTWESWNDRYLRLLTYIEHAERRGLAKVRKVLG